MAEVRTTSSTGGQKGVKLERFDLIPTGPLRELARHYGIGASKYDNHQWRNGYEWSKSYAALQRHLADFWEGKDFDVCSNDPDGCKHTDADGNPFTAVLPDACFNHTGSHHLAAVAWHAFCLLEFKDRFPEHDDRYAPEPEEEIDLDPLYRHWFIPNAQVVGFDGTDDGYELTFQAAPAGTPTLGPEWIDLGFTVEDDSVFRDYEGEAQRFVLNDWTSHAHTIDLKEQAISEQVLALLIGEAEAPKPSSNPIYDQLQEAFNNRA